MLGIWWQRIVKIMTKKRSKIPFTSQSQDFRRRELLQSLNQSFVKDVTSRDTMHIHGVSQFDNLPVTTVTQCHNVDEFIGVC